MNGVAPTHNVVRSGKERNCDLQSHRDNQTEGRELLGRGKPLAGPRFWNSGVRRGERWTHRSRDSHTLLGDTVATAGFLRATEARRESKTEQGVNVNISLHFFLTPPHQSKTDWFLPATLHWHQDWFHSTPTILLWLLRLLHCCHYRQKKCCGLGGLRCSRRLTCVAPFARTGHVIRFGFLEWGK